MGTQLSFQLATNLNISQDVGAWKGKTTPHFSRIGHKNFNNALALWNLAISKSAVVDLFGLGQLLQGLIIHIQRIVIATVPS